MKMPRVAVVTTSLLVAACQPRGPTTNQIAQMRANLDSWIGRPASEFVKAHPALEITTYHDGSTRIRHTEWGTAMVPVPAPLSATVPSDDGPSIFAVQQDPSDAFVGVDVTPREPPRTLNLAGTSYVPQRAPCNLDLFADPTGIIRSWHLSGPAC